MRAVTQSLTLAFLVILWGMYIAADETKVTVDVREELLVNVLQDLGQQAKVKISLIGHGRALITLTMRDVDLETAIKYVCLAAGVEYQKTEAGFTVTDKASPQESAYLLMADFSVGKATNNLGGFFGTFGGDSPDSACKAESSFVKEDARGKPEGKSVRIEFNNPARPFFSGFWFIPNAAQSLDLTSYDRIGFWAKAEGVTGFLLIVKDKNATDDVTDDGVATIRVSGLSDKWKHIEVPFKDFRPKISMTRIDWSAIRQFVFVCVEGNRPSKGALCLDEIYCSQGTKQENAPAAPK